MSNMFYEYRMDLARSRGIRYTSSADHRGDNCTWECPKGHSFEMSWKKVVHQVRIRCPKCPRPRKYTEQDYQRLAERHGGMCLIAPARFRSLGKWCCSEGHEFMLTGQSAFNHAVWCPFCSGRRKTPKSAATEPSIRGRVKLHELLGI